jgi:hypothetical protein
MYRLARQFLSLAAAVAALAPGPVASAGAHAGGPVAHAAGGEAPPLLPAGVRTPIRRARRALLRLGDAVDDGSATRAAANGRVVVRRVRSAWRGARHYLQHPPPYRGDDERARAHVSGDGGGAAAMADAPTLVLAVFRLDDNVVSGLVELTDGAEPGVFGPLQSTLAATLDVRDGAVDDVHRLAPPPAGDDRAHVIAHASGDEEGASFATSMPQVALMLDGELQQIDDLRADGAELMPTADAMLDDAKARILRTKRRIDGYWPPVPSED